MTMFLSMLAGDVASAHGHEFSRTPTPPARTTQGQPLGRRLTLPRAVLPSTRQRFPHGPSPLGPLVRRATTPARAAGVKLTMAELREEPEEEVEEKDPRRSEDSLSGFKMPGAFHGLFHTEEPSKPSTTVSVPFAPAVPLIQTVISSPESPLLSPTIDSPMSPNTPTTNYEQSILHAQTKRARGAKSTLRFAHPIPTRSRGKHGILRPKILLQLQQRRDSGFHRPVYDVLPATRFAPRTKIGQKIHRLHRGKDGLEADDLVVINAEHYIVSDTNSEEYEIADLRAVLGVISPIFATSVAATVAEFTLENIVWRIKAGLNGASYTLESQCETPQIARWYIPKRKRNSVMVDGSGASLTKEGRKFYFTTILPDSKQHPIIASVTETSLEVNDSYTIASREQVIVTDESTRKLIIISAAWVFFMEGWSNNYKVKPRNNSCPRPPHARARSLPVEPTRRRSIFTQSPSRSPSIQPTPIERLSCYSSSRSSEAPSMVPQRLPGAFCLSDFEVEPEQVKDRSSETTVVDRHASVTSQVATPDTANQVQHALLHSIAPTTSPKEVTTPLSEHRVVPRVRDAGNKEEKERKRRSWDPHELRPRVSLLARSMSHRLKRDRPNILTANSAYDIPIASVEDEPLSPHAGVRRFRRISQHLRHLSLGNSDATYVTAEALRPFNPLQQSSAPPTRPATAKSIAPSETTTFNNPSPVNARRKINLDFGARDGIGLLPRSAQLHVTMDGLMSAAESTDTLPDPDQDSWWHQYDQFIERHCSPVAERYSSEQSQSRSQETSQDYSREPLRVCSQDIEKPMRADSKNTESLRVELPPGKMSYDVTAEAPICLMGLPAAAPSRRRSVMQKLRSKLHV